jgi:hypothetical protein
VKCGETIGCGFDLNSNDVFFTRNGNRLPSNQILQNYVGDVALRHFPSISLGSEHDSVLVHFEKTFEYARARSSAASVPWRILFGQWSRSGDDWDISLSPDRPDGADEGMKPASKDGLSIRKGLRAADDDQSIAALGPSLMATGRLKRLVPPGPPLHRGVDWLLCSAFVCSIQSIPATAAMRHSHRCPPSD